ncbi:hypothetical protein P3X46_003637 [Hevea brasiliensis]|uniref:Legume lectin domain-containing protein n=1 Tax=Hevea brasiliensis TaxID=3981 RepID=A0ABQ9N8K2_HEVBR|nr:uncharacterized protein LOC110646349 [Hevea brasiliensis]KAJ9188265.1 hypothetical protein P3X46_003637 [Hevea brasiliensis]
MGCERRTSHIIYTIFFVWFLLFSRVHGSRSHDPESLEASIHNYAMEALVKRRTGTLLNVSLPANFSGIQASVVRLRSSSLWEKGVNFTSFYIPPRVIPFPFGRRVAIVYHNLGNWSSYYYEVPNYSLVAPVIGFVAYDASNLSALGNETLKFSALGSPIVVSFPNTGIGALKNGNAELKCVKFNDGGLVQFRNLTEGRCLTQGDGHFSIAIPSSESKKKKSWAWRVIGFAAGFIGLVLVVVIMITAYKLVRSKKIREMEGESEKGVAFDTKWIGRSKMPSASMVRTQPALEHGDIP